MTSDKQIRLQRYGIGLLRIVVGAIFVAHGAQKAFEFGLSGTAGAFGQFGIPFPTLSAALVTGIELVGGIGLVFGFLTRLAAIPLAVTMLVAMLAVHLPGGFFLPEGIEFTLVLLGGSLALALAGPGSWALDNVIRRSGAPLVDWSSKQVEPERGELRPAA